MAGILNCARESAQKGRQARGRSQVFKAAWLSRNSTIFFFEKNRCQHDLRASTLRVAFGYRKLPTQFLGLKQGSF